MTKTTFIYALLEPGSDDVRYVGKADNVDKRLKEHVYYCDVDKTHKGRWVLSLQKQGKKPKLVVLEEVPADQWQEAEKRWIAYYRKAGAPLTNIHSGGWGRSFLSDTEPTVKIEVTMPASFAAKLDILAPNNRSAWIRRAIENAAEASIESKTDDLEYERASKMAEKRRVLFSQWMTNNRSAWIRQAIEAGQPAKDG